MSSAKVYSKTENTLLKYSPKIINTQVILGLSLLLLSFYQALIFPVSNALLLSIMGIFIICQIVESRSWLLLLPAFLISVDLTPSSGRFIFNELDFIMLTIVGAGLVTNQFKISIKYKLTFIVPLLLCVLASYSINFPEVIAAIGAPQQSNPYYSNLYNFKVAKGLFYGLMLALLFSSQYLNDNYKAIKHLIFGGWIGSLLLFLVILWERHTLVPLFNLQPWWAIAASLLDLTSSYRVTGLFSDMHTGGEAIDGIFLLLVPLNFLGFYWFERNSLRIISLISLMLVGYCIIVGFTRATYFSMAISLIVFLVLHRYYFYQDKKISIFNTFSYLLLIVSSYAIYINSGYMGLVAFSLIVFWGYTGRFLQQKMNLSNVYFNLSFFGIVSTATFLSVNNHFQSKWIESSFLGLSILIVSLAMVGTLIFLITKTTKKLNLSDTFLHIFTLVAIAIFCVTAFGGSQINARMETVGKDINTRLTHWNSILDSSDLSLATSIFGNGMGSFPLNYVLTYPETVQKVGSYSIDNNQLILGNGADLAFGQRVEIEPNTDYLITMEVTGKNQGHITAFICERNLIFASNFQSNCVAKNIKVNESSIHTLINNQINTKNVGRNTNSLMRWPTLLYLKYSSKTKESSIAINNIRLHKQNSISNLLENANFNSGSDHWFFYNDYQHLPWHIKNIYLGIYYQLGLIGLLLFALMFYQLTKVNKDDILMTAFQIFLISYIVGIFSFGVFGDPLDSARTSVLFFTLLFSFQVIRSQND